MAAGAAGAGLGGGGAVLVSLMLILTVRLGKLIADIAPVVSTTVSQPSVKRSALAVNTIVLLVVGQLGSVNNLILPMLGVTSRGLLVMLQAMVVPLGTFVPVTVTVTTSPSLTGFLSRVKLRAGVRLVSRIGIDTAELSMFSDVLANTVKV